MNWSAEEEKKLYAAVLRHGEASWDLVASSLSLQDVELCRFKWSELKDRGIIRGNWCAEEDEIILEPARTVSSGAKILPSRHKKTTQGIIKWGDVATKLFGLRSGKQCRERWSNHLNPALKKEPWTEEEDEVVLTNQAILGNVWTKISKLLPGRR